MEKFFEEAATNICEEALNELIDYFKTLEILPSTKISQVEKDLYDDSISIILNYKEAKAALNMIEYFAKNHYYFDDAYLVPNTINGVILYQIRLSKPLLISNMRNIEIAFYNRFAESTLTKGQYLLEIHLAYYSKV